MAQVSATHDIPDLPQLPSPFPAERAVYPTELPSDGPAAEFAAPGYYLFPGLLKELVPDLIAEINADSVEWEDYGPRQSKNYGPAYAHFRKRYLFEKAPKEHALPSYATDIVIPKIRHLLPLLSDWEPNQLSTTRYPMPGNPYIPRHNDCQNGDIRTAVIGVCLASGYAENEQEVKRDVHLPDGSVYIMSGDALRAWEHCILAGNTEQTRYSLTFRDVGPRIENGTDAEFGSYD